MLRPDAAPLRARLRFHFSAHPKSVAVFAAALLTASSLVAQSTNEAVDAGGTVPVETRKPTKHRLGAISVLSGRPDRNLDVSATVNTVSPLDMARDGAGWLGETLNKIPGVYMAQLRGPSDAPSIRMPIVTANYYLYLQDDLPFQSPIGYTHSAFSFSAAETSFGGLEILKGPGSALHGSDAFAGVINVKTKEPSDTFGMSARVALGTSLARQARLELTGGLGGGHSVLAAVSYAGDQGFQSNSAWNRAQGVLRHRFKGADGWSLNTILLGTWYEQQMPGPLSPTVFSNSPTSDGLAANVDRSLAKQTETFGRLSVEVLKKFSDDVSLSLTPYVRYIRNNYMEIWNPATTPVDTGVERTGGARLRAFLRLGSALRLTAGLDGDATSWDYLSTQDRPTTNASGLNSPKGDHYKYHVDFLAGAPYAQATLDIARILIFDAGLRYDVLQYDYKNLADSATNGSFYRPANRVDLFTQLNPKAGLTLKLGENHSLFGRYAHGFRIPMSSDLYNLTTASGNYTLRPEQIDGYEVGWKGAFGEILDADLSAYQAELKDGIATSVATPAGRISTNGGSSLFRGIETGLDFKPVEGLTVRLSYAFTANQIVQKLAGVTSVADGKTPVSAPTNNGYAQITWRPAFAPGLFVQPEAQWIGAWWLDEANTIQKGDDVVFNFRAGWTLPKSFATINVKLLNLLDRRYPVTAEKPFGSIQYRPAPGFTAMVGLDFAL